MRTSVYPAILTPDTQQRGFVVTFPDVPEAITQGDDLPEALHQAADCLEEAIAGRIRRRESIPEASAVGPEQYAISLPVLTAAKAALYLALQQAKITQSELAERLRCDEQEVSHLLDPRRTAKISRLESALGALGYQLALGLQILVPASPSGESTGEGAHDIVVTSSRTAQGRHAKTASRISSEMREPFHPS